MKRTFFALAIAGFSFAAFAGPPPTAGPVNVNVTNNPLSVSVAGQPLTVSITPSWINKAQFFSWGTTTSELGFKEYPLTLSYAVVLTGVRVQVQSLPSTVPDDSCLVSVNHKYMKDSVPVSHRLASGIALNSKGISDVYVPLPNVYADVGDELQIIISGPADVVCKADAWIHGVIPD